jgi:hypothetical protein
MAVDVGTPQCSKTHPWDVVGHFETEEDMDACLEAAFSCRACTGPRGVSYIHSHPRTFPTARK